jgi:nucleotide-binding universal stress UspA family protein
MSPDALFKRLLIPVDGSKSSLKAARFGLRLAGHENCEVIAVHVIDEENAADLALYSDRPLEEILERMRRGAESYIEEI